MEVWSSGPSGQQMFCWFDLPDLERVQEFGGLWTANPARAPKGKFYVFAKFWKAETKSRVTTGLQRHILGLSNPSIEGHHIDNDGLNNRRLNLKIVTHIQNMRERSPDRDWAHMDAARLQAELYRQEREIATVIQEQFKLTRQTIWHIRLGKLKGNKRSKGRNALEAYLKAVKDANTQTLGELQAAHPRSGKWGVGKSGSLRAPENKVTQVLDNSYDFAKMGL